MSETPLAADALPDGRALTASVRGMHEDIRAAVSECLARARRENRRELASLALGPAAGDISFALDEVAEAALVAFGKALGTRHPLRLVAEGPGESCYGAGAGPGLVALIDPVDGTRCLMHDMRSAWAVTGLAVDRGDATRLSDVVVAVQTELPTTTAAVYHVLTAIRGQGTTLSRHDVISGACLETETLRVSDGLPLANGFYPFGRYRHAERPLVVRLESLFVERLAAAHAVDLDLVFDDMYLASAGQLFLTATGRYRMLADLRAWLAEHFGFTSFTVKPYDVAATLVFTEAGVPVLDATGAPLDAPLDTSTPLDVVAYGSPQLRETLEPLLMASMEQLLEEHSPEEHLSEEHS